MENWSRPYLEDYDQRPRLSYSVTGRFELGPEFHMLEEGLPRTLSCRRPAEERFEIEGAIEYYEDLDYLKQTIDFLTYLMDQGGDTVHDILTRLQWSQESWERVAVEGQIFNPFDHVAVSNTEHGLHTLGMVKFGRPELSVPNVPLEEVEQVRRILDRFINFQALGGVVQAGRKVEMEGLEASYLPSEVRGGPDHPTFQNFYVELVRS